MSRFSIIIVSWNALGHLKTFLPSVTETRYPDFEIILADNASTDGSAEWVRKRFPGIKIATFDRNYGYCGGNNRAVPHAEGDILVFLNNDVRVKSGWLEALAATCESDPRIAAVQPKMLSYDRPECFEYAGAAGGCLDLWGFPFCRGRLFDTLENDDGQYDEPTVIFWASGAALAIRKDIFEEMGGFDEDFEFHMEEIDLCWRLWNQGYKIAYCPKSVVYHLGGGSMPMGSPRKTYYNYRNNLFMLWKNYTYQSLLWRFPVRVLFDLVSFFREALIGRFNMLGAIGKAYVHFWISLPSVHRKRKHLQHRRTVPSEPEIIYRKSVVIQYFLKGVRCFHQLPFNQKKASV